MPTSSMLEKICEIVSEAEFREDQAVELVRLMAQFRTERWVSYRRLMLIPGFKRLWEAIEEACDRTCFEYGHDYETITGKEFNDGKSNR